MPKVTRLGVLRKLSIYTSIATGVQILFLAFSAALVAQPGVAQVRGIGAGALVLDDYNGHTLALQTPESSDPGYNSWISGGQLYLRLPLPPTSGAAMGFVYPGPAAPTETQILTWDPPYPTGTGGTQGAWRSGSLLSAISTVGLVNGTGTMGSIPVWTGTGTQGNATISENAGAITFGGYGSGVLHSNATGAIGSSPVELDAGIAEVSGTLPVTNGGTGQSSYNAGDMLYASNTTTIAKLNIGAAAQVLSVSPSGLPAWTNNGATITQASSTPVSLTTSASNYTINASATYIRLANIAAGTISITGINSASVEDGREITLANVGTQSIQLTSLDGSSNSADQFKLPGGQPIILGPDGCATFIYDTSLSKWALLAVN
jgi:hypothetical protein